MRLVTLDTLFSGEGLEHIRQDLSGTVDLINEWLDGGAIDPDQARFGGLLLLMLAGDCEPPSLGELMRCGD